MNEVLCREQMPASRELRIARLMQLSGKPFKHLACRSAADLLNGIPPGKTILSVGF